MIDIKILRDTPEKVKENCLRRGANIDVDRLVEKDLLYRKLLHDTEVMRSERRLASKEGQGKVSREEARERKKEIAHKEKQLAELKHVIDQMLSWLPNFLADDVPDGKGEEGNITLKHWGETSFSDEALDHQQLGDRLDIINTKAGVKVAQSGFFYWKGKGAQLASAVFFWAQQELTKRNFTLFFTPCMAKKETLFGTGYLPFFADQTYSIEGENLALIGTSEQTLVAYHAREVLEEKTLPLCYAAFTPCFRTEAGSYGKETRGIFRVHQFHKVEQIVFCTPETSEQYHLMCLENEEYLLQKLSIPYRVVNVCVGDIGAPGYKKYDVEAFFPGYGGYREVCSNTNLTDFQTRRLKIRYKNNHGKKEFLHTISATAVTDRVICAILENYQQKDGSVVIPEVLRPYTGFDIISLK